MQQKECIELPFLMRHVLAFANKAKMSLPLHDLPSNSLERTIVTGRIDLATRTDRPLAFYDFSQVNIPNRIPTRTSSWIINLRVPRVGGSISLAALMRWSHLMFRSATVLRIMDHKMVLDTPSRSRAFQLCWPTNHRPLSPLCERPHVYRAY